MNDHELSDLAWRINSLLSDPRIRRHFLRTCREYLALRADTPGPIGDPRGEMVHEDPGADPCRPPPLPFGTDGDFDLKPPLLPCERYAILAALHEVICNQEPPVAPAPRE